MRFTGFSSLSQHSLHENSKLLHEIGHRVTLVTDYDHIGKYDLLYVAKVFTDTYVPESILRLPNVIYGGTGFFYDKAPRLPLDIEHHMPDYHLYDKYIDSMVAKGRKRKEFEYYTYYSIGRLTQGCFRGCPYCVNRNKKKVEFNAHVSEFLDKDRKYIVLLDDQFLGYKDWEPLLQ